MLPRRLAVRRSRSSGSWRRPEGCRPGCGRGPSSGCRWLNGRRSHAACWKASHSTTSPLGSNGHRRRSRARWRPMADAAPIGPGGPMKLRTAAPGPASSQKPTRCRQQEHGRPAGEAPSSRGGVPYRPIPMRTQWPPRTRLSPTDARFDTPTPLPPASSTPFESPRDHCLIRRQRPTSAPQAHPRRGQPPRASMQRIRATIAQSIAPGWSPWPRARIGRGAAVRSIPYHTPSHRGQPPQC